jgi:LPXTG-motif cell wall-anchored protein
MMNIQKLRIANRHRRSTGRRAALLAGLATLIGVPLLGALPATAADTPTSLTVSSDGATISVTFDRWINLSDSVAEQYEWELFKVKNDGTEINIGNPSALGDTLTIPLILEGGGKPIYPGDVVTVSYDFQDAPASWDLLEFVKDASGNDLVTPLAVPAFSDLTATNNSTLAPPAISSDIPPIISADRLSIVLTFDQALNENPTAGSSTLTVTADGSAVTVSRVAMSSTQSGLGVATVLLSSAVPESASVTVVYDFTTPGCQCFLGNYEKWVQDFTVTNIAFASVTTTTTTTTAPATTVPATENTTPSLVTEENQDALTAAAGSAKLIVNGEEVEMTLSSTGANDAGATAPEDRTEAQITELQDAADGIVERLDTAAGGDSGLTVVDTDTGAEIDGIFDDTRVPVEDVIVAESTQFSGLYASRDEDGNPNKIRAEVLEMERGGEVAVFVYGLPAGESAELVLMSTPYLLGTATADSSGNFSKVLSPPEAILAGTHTLVTASETLSVSLGIKITEPAADVTLPATGGGDFSTTPVLLVVLVGAFFVVLARRRENAEN